MPALPDIEVYLAALRPRIQGQIPDLQVNAYGVRSAGNRRIFQTFFQPLLQKRNGAYAPIRTCAWVQPAGTFLATIFTFLVPAPQEEIRARRAAL